MTCFEHRLKRRAAATTACVLAGFAASCAQPPDEHPYEAQRVAVIQQAQLGDLAKMCGLECKAEGIAEGNASISGVASVDAFFQSVVNFQAKADNVSAGIEAELAAIRGDFGIAAGADLGAELDAQISANLEAGLTIEAEPARCVVDAEATIEAQARCDAEFSPGSAMVKCEGSCEVEASANVECGAEAELKCTVVPPMGSCEGSCQGSCEAQLTAAASCEGTCRGSCTGECSAYAKDGQGNAQCAGTCDGMCMGSCEVELAAEAECTGTCKGECTFTPPDGNCEGGIRAKCEAMGSAMIDCDGRCEGNFEPPMAKAECQASAKAEARLNVECSPPRLAIKYELKANADVEAQARFVAGLRNLEVRLPALLAATARADLVLEAGAGLVADAGGAVKGAVEDVDASADLRVSIGLGCALAELPNVSSAIEESTGRLQGSLTASADITALVSG